MTDARTDLWREWVSEVLEEHKISATNEQVSKIATAIQVCAENMDMAFPVPSGPSPELQELEKLHEELKRERNKMVCPK